MPREMFGENTDIEVGMQFHAQDHDGQNMIVTVINVSETEVIVDGNHPLAGENLHFDVEVIDVREATATELEYGHPHAGECSTGCCD